MGDTEARAIDKAAPGEAPKYEGPNKAALEGWRRQTPPIALDPVEDADIIENLPKP